MNIRITGKTLDIGDVFRQKIKTRLQENLEKYFDGTADASATISREGNEFRTDYMVSLSTGIVLKSSGMSTDPYASCDIATDRLEKRLRRYKRRLKNHHAQRREPITTFDAPIYVIEPKTEEESEAEKYEQTHTHDQNSHDHADMTPLIISEETEKIQEMTVSEAVMQLDLSDAQFIFFRNARHGNLNIAYRRDDGNIGWIDPHINQTK